MSRPSIRSRRVRTVTGLLAVTLMSVGLTGCTGSSSAPPHATTVPRPPTAEELAQADAVALTRALLADVSSARPGTAARLRAVNAVASGHSEQLTALGAAGSTTPDASTTTSGSTDSSTPGAEGSPVTTAGGAAAVTVPALAKREFAAAEQTLTSVSGVEPGLATLLARLAAGFAVNADVLARAADRPLPGVVRPAAPPSADQPSGVSPSGPSAPPPDQATATAGAGTRSSPSPSGPVATPSLSPAATTALSQELAAEHAAVYAFGLIAGRLDGARRDRALDAYETHLRARDALERTLLAVGVDPPVAAPAYDVGLVPTTVAQVKTLAARVESGLAAAAAQSVGATEGQARTDAAVRLVEAARRAAAWTGTHSPLPGEGVAAPTATATTSATGSTTTAD